MRSLARLILRVVSVPRALAVLFVATAATQACVHKPAAPAPSTPLACDALSTLALPHAHVTEAHFVAATGAGPHGEPALPAHCRVLGVSEPTADSSIRFEVLLPDASAWNGRYQQVGNGGFAGQIPEEDMLPELAAGFAVAGTDDGHEAKAATDARWALGHPEKLVDYGYRALKETSDDARAIVRAFAGKGPRYSYFIGCSDGGREALIEAQRYPDDFDGIVAGAPANYLTRITFAFAANVLALAATPASYIPASKLPSIQAAALKACGGEDGVVQDPLACKFDPAVLRCSGAEREDCLTDPQLTALHRIYDGARDPRTGAQIEPGLEPGAETGWVRAVLWRGPLEADGGSASFRYASNFFRYMVFSDPAYDLHQLTFDADLDRVLAKVTPILDSDSPDLSAFQKRGGKLLQYHGLADQLIPPRDSIRYFESVRAKMGDTSGFYRLFLAPGMFHCEGGPGPDELATRDALVAWVERGQAPERVLATKSDGVGKPPIRTRPLCPYPQQAKWDGSGDRKRAESYLCAASH